MSKHIWQSKTFWVNVLTVIGSIVMLVPGSFELPPEVLEGMLFFLGIVNILLRVLSAEPIKSIKLK